VTTIVWVLGVLLALSWVALAAAALSIYWLRTLAQEQAEEIARLQALSAKEVYSLLESLPKRPEEYRMVASRESTDFN